MTLKICVRFATRVPWLLSLLFALRLAVPLTALGQSSCVSAPSGLVGWWKGETNVNDSAGTNNGTTPFGIAYTNGLVGQAFRFTASGTRVSIPDNDIFALTNSLTIEGWVNIAGDGGVIFFRGDDRIAFDPFALTMGRGRLLFTIESSREQL